MPRKVRQRKTKQIPLPPQVRRNDSLAGRGGITNFQPGNKILLKIIAYISTVFDLRNQQQPVPEKGLLATAILEGMVHLFGTTFWKKLKKTPDETAYLPPTEAHWREAKAKIMQRFRENNQEIADSNIDHEILKDVERLKDYLFRTRFPDVGEEIHNRLVGSPRMLFVPAIRAGTGAGAGAAGAADVVIPLLSSRPRRPSSMTDSNRPVKRLRHTPTVPGENPPSPNISDDISVVAMPAFQPDWPPTFDLESTVADINIAQDADLMSPSAIAGAHPKTASFDSIERSNEVHPIDPHGFSKDETYPASVQMNEEPAPTGRPKTTGLDDSAQLCDHPVDSESSEFLGDLFDDDNKNTAPAATGGLKTTGHNDSAQFDDRSVDSDLRDFADFYLDDDNKNTAPAVTGGLETAGLDDSAQFCDFLVDNELSECSLSDCVLGDDN